MSWFKRNRVTLLLVLVLLVGFGLLLYPTVSNYWNQFHQSRAIVHYTQTVSNMDGEAYQKILKDAQAYNEKLRESGILWRMTDEDLAEYNALLNMTDDGSMGYIQIPKINCELVLYHGTDLNVLNKNIGHLEGTSLPVGGKGSHCVLSGHRGLPSARLFTDLDKVSTGDRFILHVMDQVLTYEVDQIRVVLPTELSDLAIDPEQDYCTLLTCTPYGVNTHRLLVRGHRVDNAPSARRIAADALQVDPTLVAPVIGTVIVLILLAIVLFRTRKKKPRPSRR